MLLPFLASVVSLPHSSFFLDNTNMYCCCCIDYCRCILSSLRFHLGSIKVNQCTTDKLFFISADTDIYRYIPINPIFQINRSDKLPI